MLCLVPRDGIALFRSHVSFIQSTGHWEPFMCVSSVPPPAPHPRVLWGSYKLSLVPVGLPRTAFCLQATEDRRTAGVGEIKGKQLFSGLEEMDGSRASKDWLTLHHCLSRTGWAGVAFY